MIGWGVILLGFLLLYLGWAKLDDRRTGRHEFGPMDTTGLHPLVGKVFKLQRFVGHVDIFVFSAAGLLAIIIGITAIIRGD